MFADIINQPPCRKHRLLLMYFAANIILGERSLFQTASFVSCFVSPSITLSNIVHLFLSVSLFLLLSTSPSVILSNYQTQTNVFLDRQSLQVEGGPTWVGRNTLVHIYNLYWNQT
ncbi:hypothetical protein AMECASPLE_027424 [Ameca splendens]|uniref:Uncharacterized protein n=1 Tax=Ameca splendens TaxID=208324 RepID=A0ABV1ACL9_9TELE